MREEYLAITNAGIIVQIDEPSFAENWDQFATEPSLADYQKFTMVRVEALNHALRGIPRELVRFHCCWGSAGTARTRPTSRWPTSSTCSCRSTPARTPSRRPTPATSTSGASGRTPTLPDDVVLVPGVVGHATNVIEHPQLVADRIERFVDAVGPDRVIAATDCGLGGRVHPQIAWAKLEALAQGAELASRQLVA